MPPDHASRVSAEIGDSDFSPAQVVAAIDARSRHVETPCGSGSMIWRRWGQGSAPALVLLHGGYGSWTHWLKNVESLAARYTVWAADLPGLGEFRRHTQARQCREHRRNPRHRH